jgi:putative endonuclease
MAEHNDTGSWGEMVAREYLITKGYAIVDSNFRSGHNEIDIIATKGGRIAFVEVKTRHSDFSDPLDAIDRRKMARLASAANSFLRNYGIPHAPQFDVITVVGTKDDYKLTHYEDAFRPPLRTR